MKAKPAPRSLFKRRPAVPLNLSNADALQTALDRMQPQNLLARSLGVIRAAADRARTDPAIADGASYATRITETLSALEDARRRKDIDDAVLLALQLTQTWMMLRTDAVFAQDVRAREASSQVHSKNLEASNRQRSSNADARALGRFDQWQRRTRAVLPKDAAVRVKKYLATGQVRTDREKRRIRELLKAGRIPPLP